MMELLWFVLLAWGLFAGGIYLLGVVLILLDEWFDV